MSIEDRCALSISTHDVSTSSAFTMSIKVAAMVVGLGADVAVAFAAGVGWAAGAASAAESAGQGVITAKPRFSCSQPSSFEAGRTTAEEPPGGAFVTPPRFG